MRAIVALAVAIAYVTFVAAALTPLEPPVDPTSEPLLRGGGGGGGDAPARPPAVL